MPHDVTLITTLAAGFGLALVLGVLAARLKLPALVGYLLAGIAIGPHTPGFVADAALAAQLAEVGVMLLMFGVGLHFSVEDLMAVKRVAVPGAVVQMGVATALGAGLALLWGWTAGQALVFGLSLSVASTVVLLKALERQGLVDAPAGRLAVGWLVVEDLAMVLVLVLLPAVAPMMQAGGSASVGAAPGDASATSYAAMATELGLTLLKVGAFVALMLVVGRRLLPWLLWQVTRTGSRELFTLAVVAAAVGIAFGSAAIFGVSFALGAFFAGMVLRESEFSARAAEQTLPLQDAFAVLFFVSVGMLFDPGVLIDRPGAVLATLAVIVVGKTVAAVALGLALRLPVGTALTVAAGLAQVGEFSFILAGLGLALGLLPAEGQSLVLAGALLSIALNPVLMRATAPLEAALRRRWPGLPAAPAEGDDPLNSLPLDTDRRFLARQVVLVGHGRLGSRIAARLAAQSVPTLVVDRAADVVQGLREQGRQAVLGDATDPDVLVQAHVHAASALVLTMADAVAARQMVDTARTLNPSIAVVWRCATADEAARFEADGLGDACFAEQELAHAMARRALQAQVPQAGARPREATPDATAAAPIPR